MPTSRFRSRVTRAINDVAHHLGQDDALHLDPGCPHATSTRSVHPTRCGAGRRYCTSCAATLVDTLATMRALHRYTRVLSHVRDPRTQGSTAGGLEAANVITSRALAGADPHQLGLHATAVETLEQIQRVRLGPEQEHRVLMLTGHGRNRPVLGSPARLQLDLSPHLSLPASTPWHLDIVNRRKIPAFWLSTVTPAVAELLGDDPSLAVAVVHMPRALTCAETALLEATWSRERPLREQLDAVISACT